MKVLLIDPPQKFLAGRGRTRQVQPLGLAYVASAIEDRAEVRFLLPDTRAWRGDDPWSEIKGAIESEAPDVVGLTAVTASFPSAAATARAVKQVSPDILTILGGVHASTDPIGAMRGAPEVDAVVSGEGEHTMQALLDALDGGRIRDPGSIEGLVWRDGAGQIQRNAPRASIADLDSLPTPKRDGLVWPQDIHPTFYQAMITLRGCPYRCIYCAVPGSSDRRTRYRSAAHVVDEIASLRQRHDIPYLFFHDSVFSLHRGRTVEICDLLIERGLQLPFACQTRADRVDPDLLDRLKAAGCHQIFFGIESGDLDSLKKIRKKMSLGVIEEAVAQVKARGIRCTGFFMVGFPWETEALVLKTADFACGLGLDAISLFSATPLPGTELWDMAGGEHMPDAIDFRTPQVNLTRMSHEQYRRAFEHVSAQIAAHNRSKMMDRFSELVPDL